MQAGSSAACQLRPIVALNILQHSRPQQISGPISTTSMIADIMTSFALLTATTFPLRVTTHSLAATFLCLWCIRSQRKGHDGTDLQVTLFTQHTTNWQNGEHIRRKNWMSKALKVSECNPPAAPSYHPWWRYTLLVCSSNTHYTFAYSCAPVRAHVRALFSLTHASCTCTTESMRGPAAPVPEPRPAGGPYAADHCRTEEVAVPVHWRSNSATAHFGS